jgi:2-aminoadipate transaminase
MIDEGDCVVVSEPTYPGAISAFSAFQASYCPIEIDEHGMNTDLLEETLNERRKNGMIPPKMVYVIPNGHNPGGVTMSFERRKHLLRIASDNDLIIVEDDPYQLINYTDETIVSLQELDTEGRVIRLDSFSKIFVPGFRIGYVSGAKDIVRYFELYKQSSNLHTSSFNQRVIASYLKEAGSESLLNHIKGSCALYKKNRDAMVDAAMEFLPESVNFNIPQSGLFIWFSLGEEVNCEAMHRRFTESHKVLLVPGSAFSTKGGCVNCMRASFSTVKQEDIRVGIERFAEMITDFRVESRR